MEFEWTSPTGILQPFQRLNFLLAERQNVAGFRLTRLPSYGSPRRSFAERVVAGPTVGEYCIVIV
jgi:hypothetical protein